MKTEFLDFTKLDDIVGNVIKPCDCLPYEEAIEALEEIRRLQTENKKLREALRLNMEWIGPPPTDKYSYDSLREDAWAKGRAALEEGE